jgi:hypothetical protein
VAAAAYRSGVALLDERTGITHDFTRRAGVVATEIVAPTDAGAFARNRETLWNAAEAAEKRKDARTAREWIVALPAELDAEQRANLAHDLACELVDRYGVVADVAIHAPSRDGDDRNQHAHILTTTRRIEGEALCEKCALELSDTKRKTLGLGPAADEISALRERWAELANAALKKAGSAARIDHRSLVARQDAAFERGDLAEALALDRPAQVHVGVHATQLDRRSGQAVSRRGRMRARVMMMARHAAASGARWAQGLIEAMRPEAETLILPVSAVLQPADGIDPGVERRHREDAERRKDEKPLADLIQKWRTRAGEARSKPDVTHEKEETKMSRSNESAAPAAPRQVQPQQRQKRERDGGPDGGSQP